MNTDIRLGRAQLELNDSNLRFLNPRWTTCRCYNILVQNNAIDKLCVFDCATDFLHDSDVSKVNV